MKIEELQFGCEFEFYVNIEKEDELQEKLRELSDNNLHVNLYEDSLVNDNQLMQYECNGCIDDIRYE